MTKTRSFFALLVVGLAWWVSVETAVGQTVERDTTITGPRGRTLERQVEIQRGPGTIDRQVQIKRPGGTFDRQVQIQRSPAVGPARGWPALPGPWPRGPWFPRPVVVGPAAPAIGFGLLATPMLNFSFGGGGGGGGPIPPGGVGGPAGPTGPGMPAAGPPPPPDQVALMTQRLQSFQPGARKDAAYTLGRLGDPRAVPSLVHVLKYDLHKDVRIAAAIGLGEIGGPDAAIGLERCSIYEKREDVRKAASTALERLNAKAKAAPPISSHVTAPASTDWPPPTGTSSPFRGSPPQNGPAPEPPGASPEAPQSLGEPSLTQPPPPPTPVPAGPAGAANR